MELTSPAQNSARTLLVAGQQVQDYGVQSVLHITWKPGMLEKHLGPPTGIQDGWDIWDKEDYILYRGPHGFLDADTTKRGPEETLKAIHWDLGQSEHTLPRREWEAYQQQGITCGNQHKFPVPSMSPEDLKQFVLDYCNGHILCDHQIQDTSLVGMVFLPLLMGALDIPDPKEGEKPDPAWVAQKALLDSVSDPGPEPIISLLPPDPEKPEYPPQPPVREDFQEPDPKQVHIIEDDIRYGVAPQERLDNYLEVIRLHNVEVEYHRKQVLVEWEAEKAAIDKAHEAALVEHRKACRKQEIANKGVKRRHREWSLKRDRQEALRKGFTQGRMSNLGTIFEHLDKAAPRGINGYPMFLSFRLVNKSDWDRARKAIGRELEHRRNMEL